MAVTHTELAELTEQSLVESWHAGDHAAFDRIVRRYQAGLLAHARRRLGSEQAAEDAVQETLLRADRALPRFNGEYRLGNWLHRILRNVCVDEANRNRRRLALVDRLRAADPPCAHEAVEQTVIGRDSSAVVRALDELPESYRTAFVLRAVDELPYDEVAQACGISEENARARVSRARTVLRRTTARFSAFVTVVGFNFRRGRASTVDPTVAPAAPAAPATATSATTAASSATSVASNASSAVSSVVSGPSPLAIQLTAAVHDFAPAAGAASRAIAVLASAAAVVLPAALAPDRGDSGGNETRAGAATDTTQVVEIELTSGESIVEVPAEAVAPSTSAPPRAPQVTATDLTVHPDGQGWTVGGRLSIDTGTELYEGTIEPYSRLTLAPADASDATHPRSVEITAYVTLDDGRALTFQFTGSAALDVPEPEPAEVPVTTTTAPPPLEDPQAPITTTTLVADGSTPPPAVIVTTTTAPPAAVEEPAAPTDDAAPPATERFELGGMYSVEGEAGGARRRELLRAARHR